MLHKTLFITALLITALSFNNRINAEEFSCPPHDSFLTCSKAVATKYQNCAEEAKKVHNGEKLTRALDSCKFEAKASNLNCQNSCKKAPTNVRVG
jgi:hypothetical protein